MSYFPLFIDLADRKILVIGGGNVAERKVETLLRFNAHITLIAPSLNQEINKLAQDHQITVINREVQFEDLNKGYDLCFITTDNEKLNHDLASYARSLNILVNTADDPKYCDFYFPAIVKRGDLVVGVGSNGKAPAVSREVRKRVSELLPENIEPILEKLAIRRAELLHVADDPIYQELLDQVIGILNKK